MPFSMSTWAMSRGPSITAATYRSPNFPDLTLAKRTRGGTSETRVSLAMMPWSRSAWHWPRNSGVSMPCKRMLPCQLCRGQRWARTVMVSPSTMRSTVALTVMRAASLGRLAKMNTRNSNMNLNQHEVMGSLLSGDLVNLGHLPFGGAGQAGG